MNGADLDRLLERTSRTFALSIPLLPEPTRREVGLAYLLFRIADTFEDATLWPPERRIAALAEFSTLLEAGDPAAETASAERWASDPPCAQAGYVELLRESPAVLADFRALRPGAAATIREHVAASAQGMARFVARTRDGELRLADLDDLKAYCYVVAGIVGEMLTDLFLLDRAPLAPIAPYLRDRAARFGEGLQLVNILKDAGSDRTEGRRYLPEGIDPAEVFALARRDLGLAGEYVLALQRAGAPSGIVGFTALPVELAWATLDRVETRGPGAKVSRPEVYRIVSKLRRDLERGNPAVRVRTA